MNDNTYDAWPSYTPDEILPGLYQGGTEDDLVVGAAIPADHYAWGKHEFDVVVTLGDMYAGETRKVLFRLDVPAVPALGLATVADVVFEYTSMPDLAAHHVTFPISVMATRRVRSAGSAGA